MTKSESIGTSRKKIMLCLQAEPYPEKLLHFASEYFNQPGNLFKILIFKNRHTESKDKFADRQNPVAVPAYSINALKSEAKRILQTGQPPSQRRIIIHQVTTTNLSELLKDTLYTDVLIVTENHFKQFSYTNRQLIGFSKIRQLVQCPVLVVPLVWETFREIVLVYDGKLSTFLSIKKLITFFPNMFQALSVTLLILPPDDDEAWDNREEKLLIAYLKFHCHDLAIHKVFQANLRTLGLAMNLHPHALLVKQEMPCGIPSYLNKAFSHLETLQLFNFS